MKQKQIPISKSMYFFYLNYRQTLCKWKKLVLSSVYEIMNSNTYETSNMHKLEGWIPLTTIDQGKMQVGSNFVANIWAANHNNTCFSFCSCIVLRRGGQKYLSIYKSKCMLCIIKQNYNNFEIDPILQKKLANTLCIEGNKCSNTSNHQLLTPKNKQKGKSK